jgi:fucose 4-O-acetylase-like acetyltransferase
LPAVTKRLESLDICRGIAIILVIYGHALEISFPEISRTTDTLFILQWQVIYSFHMSLFFFISGLVYRHHDWHKVFSSSLYLIAISISVQIIGWLIVVLINANEHQTVLSMMKSFFRPLLTLSEFTVSVLWFLVALAFVRIAYECILRSSAGWRLVIVLIVIASFVVNRAAEKYIFQIGPLLPGLIFYAIGQHIGKSNIHKIERKATILKLLVATAAVIVLAPLNQGDLINPFEKVVNKYDHFGVILAGGEIGFFPIFLATGILGSFAALYGAFIIFRRYKTVSFLLSKIGRHTIELLIINGLIMTINPGNLYEFIGTKNDGLSCMILAVALTSIQLALLPIWIKILKPLMTTCKIVSQNIMGRAASYV